MKILFLYNHVPHEITGGSIATIGMLLALKNEGVKTDLAVLNTSKFPRDPREALYLANNVFATDVNIDINVKDALKNLFFSKLPYNLERYYTPKFNELLQKLRKGHSYDLIHLDTTHMGLYLPELKKFNIPILLRPHNVEFEIYKRLSRNMKNPLKKWYYNLLAQRMKRFEQETLPQYDGLIPLTKRDLQHLQKLGFSGDYEIIPLAEWLKDCEYIPVEEEEDSAGFIGNLRWHPNVEAIDWFLEKVVPILLRKKPDIKIEIAGRGTPERLKKYNSENVKIVGEVASDKEFTRKHAVMLSPLLSGSGMRIKIVKAFTQSKYVVSSSIGAEGIAEKDCDFIRIADTPEDFADKIIEGIENKELRRKIKQNAYKQATENYVWDKLGKKLVNFYRKILAKS